MKWEAHDPDPSPLSITQTDQGRYFIQLTIRVTFRGVKRVEPNAAVLEIQLLILVVLESLDLWKKGLAELHVVVKEFTLEGCGLLTDNFEPWPIRMEAIHDHCLHLEVRLH